MHFCILCWWNKSDLRFFFSLYIYIYILAIQFKDMHKVTLGRWGNNFFIFILVEQSDLRFDFICVCERERFSIQGHNKILLFNN